MCQIAAYADYYAFFMTKPLKGINSVDLSSLPKTISFWGGLEQKWIARICVTSGSMCAYGLIYSGAGLEAVSSKENMN